ncbi:MAG TPA: YetF domain-containing protein [Chloroflexia bacterium]
MDAIFDIDWRRLFVPELPILEILIRGTVIYLGIFILLRLVLKRETGTLGITDLLVVVFLADAAQNAMAGDYHSITEGLILVGTIVFWSYALSWLGYRFPRVQRFINPPPLLLVKEGRMIPRNLRQELLTSDELMSQLRQQGVRDLAEVKEAFMEGDGRISVIPYNGPNPKTPERTAG